MKKQAIVDWILVLCFVLGFSASTSLGQAVYGSIFGTVTDAQGNAVAGAKVTVTSFQASYFSVGNLYGAHIFTARIADSDAARK